MPPPPPYRRRPLWRRLLAWADGLGLAALSVVVACRALDIDGRTPVPQLLAFLPWLLVPAGVGLLLALLARWRTGMVWALVVLAATGWYVRPYGPGGDAEPAGHLVAPVRVLTSNVQYGRATPDLIATIQREKPDLVFVQECEYDCSRALDTEIPDASYPYREVVEASGSDGSAILSKYPLRPAPGIAGAMAMPGAVAKVHDRLVRVQLVHPLPPVPGQVSRWRAELGAIRDYAGGGKDGPNGPTGPTGPTLIAGDFNASQDHAAFRRILDAGGLRDSAALGGAFRTPSWPVDGPRIGARVGTQIDHVLASDDFSVRSARFLTLKNTDHRALLVELELHSG